MSDDSREVVLTGPQTGASRRIDRMWAVVVKLDDGDEGIPIVFGPQGQPAPLLATDEERLEWITRAARDWSSRTGKPARLVRFREVELVETFYPDGRRERAG